MKPEGDAGPSRIPIKDEKRNTKRKRIATTKTPTILVPDNPSSPSKTKAERNREKYQEWRQRKRQKERATQHVDSDPTTPIPLPLNPQDPADDDMAIEVMFTTSTGKLVTSQNVGIILTKYLQAFQKNPEKFVARYEYTLTPPEVVNPKWKPDPNNPHQPPPDSLNSCTIYMPKEIEPNHVRSTPPGFRSKSLAKRDAMAVMVKRLMEVGRITQDLVPIPHGVEEKTVGAKDRKDLKWFEHQEKLGKISSPDALVEGTTLNQRWAAFKTGVRDRLPTMPESEDGRKGIADYVPVITPAFWVNLPSFGTSGTNIDLFPTLFELKIDGCADECRIICVLTTRPIPSFDLSDTCPIRHVSGSDKEHMREGEMDLSREIDLSIRAKENTSIKPVIARVILRTGPPMTKLSESQLSKALMFTRTILNTHLAQPVTGDLTTCRWLVLPTQRGFDPKKHSKIKRKHIDWDQVESGIKLEPIPFPLDLLDTLSDDALSETMFGVSDLNRLIHIHRAHKDFEGSLAGSVALPGRKGGLVNELASTTVPVPDLKDIRARHPISASVYRTTSMLPTMFHHIDSILIARQASETIFSSAVNPSSALLALTPRKTSEDLHHSYERLEFLGDTLLKLVGTIDVFARPPEVLRNVEVEKERHLMLSNRMLHKCGEDAGIPPYIRNRRFTPASWMPHGWSLENGQVVEVPPQTLGLKVVADVVEAFIGAAYLSRSRSLDSAIKAILDLHIPITAIKTWSDAAAASARDMEPAAPAPVETEGWLGALAKPSLTVLGYKFRDPFKGQFVLNRSPTPGTSSTAVRYKLLGNAVLEYFVVESMWDRCPDAGPPALTEMKHSRISDMTLSALCATLPVFDQLTDIPIHLQTSYKKYRNLVMVARARADSEISVAASSGDIDPLSTIGKDWWSDIPHNHVLGDILESIIGAILVDSGYNVEACRKIYIDSILPYMDKYCHGPHGESQHPKDLLFKLMSQRKCQHFKIRRDGLNAKSSDWDAVVVVHGTEVGKGSGPWQELAVRRACAEVIGKIREDKEWIEGVCDCRGKPPK